MKKGFSTIELLIAFAILLLVLPPMMILAFGGQTSTLDVTLTNGGVTRVATQIRDAVASTTANWNANPLPWATAFYTQSNSVSSISPCLKQITASTNWTSGARSQEAVATTYVPNIAEAQALGLGNCDPFPPSDWDNPDTFGVFNPVGITNNGVKATAVSVRSTDGDLYAFMTSVHDNENEPDFWIIDVTDPENPSHVSSIDLSNGFKFGGSNKEGANDLVVVGDYAYVLRNYKIDQLQVINISNLNNPTPISPSISFEPHGVLQTGTDPQGEVIKYYDGRLYIGLHTTQGPEFLVFDISSTPATPNFVGAIAIGFDHSINDIVIKDDYAFVAIAPGTSAVSTKELMVLDISNPTPVNTGNGFNAQTTGGDTEAATALYLLNNTLYMGRERVSNSSERDLYVFDVSNPIAPTVIGSKNLGLASNSIIKAMYVSSRFAFIGTTKNNEFQIWDISNPSDIKVHGCGGFNFPQEISDIAYADGLIFATIWSNDFFRVIHDETSDPTCN